MLARAAQRLFGINNPFPSRDRQGAVLGSTDWPNLIEPPKRLSTLIAAIFLISSIIAAFEPIHARG